jgi:hypothetical protein
MKYACLAYHDAIRWLPVGGGAAGGDPRQCEAAAAWKADLKKRGHHVLSVGCWENPSRLGIVHSGVCRYDDNQHFLAG